jgi:hypothetical protein
MSSLTPYWKFVPSEGFNFPRTTIGAENHSLYERTPLSPRFRASGVTLSGLAGGEYLPLPASKGPAFPFLFALDGYPTPFSNFAHRQDLRSELRKLHI